MKKISLLIILFLQGCFSNTNNDLKHSTVNDTGIDTCSENFGTNLGFWTSGLTCALINYSANKWVIQQDGFFGRDVLALMGELSKIGSGLAGFDYTRMNHLGIPLELQNSTWNENGTAESGAVWDCVRDNVTELWWETKKSDPTSIRYNGHVFTWFNSNQSTNGGDVGTEIGGSCVGANDPVKCNTEAYVASINNAGLCGHKDWRLPTIKELMSLVNFGRVNGQLGIDTNYFPNTSPNWTWSSTPDIACPACAWVTSFNQSDLFNNIDHKNSAFPVRLVRGVSTFDASDTRFTVVLNTSESEIFDNLTKLTWQRCAVGMSWDGMNCTGSANNYTWQEALEYSQILSESSVNEKKWRLPNVNELYTIVDHLHATPSINVQWFPQTPATSTWSSSPYIQEADKAWVVGFSSGYTSTNSASTAQPIRMVRD